MCNSNNKGAIIHKKFIRSKPLNLLNSKSKGKNSILLIGNIKSLKFSKKQSKNINLRAVYFENRKKVNRKQFFSNIILNIKKEYKKINSKSKLKQIQPILNDKLPTDTDSINGNISYLPNEAFENKNRLLYNFNDNCTNTSPSCTSASSELNYFTNSNNTASMPPNFFNDDSIKECKSKLIDRKKFRVKLTKAANSDQNLIETQAANNEIFNLYRLDSRADICNVKINLKNGSEPSSVTKNLKYEGLIQKFSNTIQNSQFRLLKIRPDSNKQAIFNFETEKIESLLSNSQSQKIVDNNVYDRIKDLGNSDTNLDQINLLINSKFQVDLDINSILNKRGKSINIKPETSQFLKLCNTNQNIAKIEDSNTQNDIKDIESELTVNSNKFYNKDINEHRIGLENVKIRLKSNKKQFVAQNTTKNMKSSEPKLYDNEFNYTDVFKHSCNKKLKSLTSFKPNISNRNKIKIELKPDEKHDIISQEKIEKDKFIDEEIKIKKIEKLETPAKECNSSIINTFDQEPILLRSSFKKYKQDFSSTKDITIETRQDTIYQSDVGIEPIIFQNISQKSLKSTKPSYTKKSKVNELDPVVMQSFDYYNDLIIKKSKIHGLGIFTPVMIKKDTLIMEYKGEIIGKCVSDKREKFYRMNNLDSVYMFTVTEDMIIDATMIGNKARYINHSCNPNCQAITSMGDKSIKYCSIKDINPGEELTINYNMPLDDTGVCMCGDEQCLSKCNTQ